MIIMYHYVRLSDSFSAKVNNFYDFDLFKKNIYGLLNNGKVFLDPKSLTTEQWLDVAEDSNSIVLTFDDGYIDHVRLVAPFLKDIGIHGLFFVPAKILVTREILLVNKIHLMLHRFRGREAQLMEHLIQYLIQIERFGTDELNDLKSKYLKDGKYDGAVTNFLKRVFQNKFESSQLSSFCESFLDDEPMKFDLLRDELYMAPDDFSALQKQGHSLGLHGYNHFYLSSLSKARQKMDFEESINVFREFGVSQDLLIAYPYGDYNSDTLDICEEFQIKAGFIDNRLNTESYFPSLTLPRIDCNDFFTNH